MDFLDPNAAKKPTERKASTASKGLTGNSPNFQKFDADLKK